MRTMAGDRPRPEIFNRLADGRAVLLGALAAALAPAEYLAPADWAARRRVVSAEGGSRYPGPWRHERAPHLVEILDALAPDDPASDVVIVASAQIGKSEVALNFVGWIVDVEPGPCVVVLPSIEEARKWSALKLGPMIDETPTLRRKVLDFTERTGDGSTASFKRFPRGYVQLTYAGSSKGLQMVTARYTVADELSEWPAEAGQRGDPAAQLEKRTETYEGREKRLWVSTPGVVGACRISARYEKSDRRRRYVQCPHCGAWQVLTFAALKWSAPVPPYGAWFQCLGNGCVIEEADRPAMLAGGVWIATAGDGDEGVDRPGAWFAGGELERWRSRKVASAVRGFHLWKAYSTFTSWGGIVRDWLEAEGRPELERVFWQQVLGEPYEEKGEAPDAELLHRARIAELERGRVPAGPLVLTGAVDVQGQRLEWAVWGWSEGLTRWLVDWGIVEGDPNSPATWAELERKVIVRRWPTAAGGERAVEAWAVDSGYATQAVYNFVRRRPGVIAVKGQAGRSLPMLGAPSKVDVSWQGQRVGTAMVWPVGTHALKTDHYGAVRSAIAGPDESGAMAPGAMILPGDVDLAYCEQLTAEYLARVERRSGASDFIWQKLAGRANEALDIACYARAAAYHLELDRLTAGQWAELRARRSEGPAQPDLFALAIAPAEAPSAPRGGPRRRRGLRGQVRG